MFISQLSIFLENKSGQFPEILDVLAKGSIRILAASVADTAEYGILRMITEDNDRAFELLAAAKVSVSRSDVFLLSTQSYAGSFSELLKPFSKNGINIMYMYYFAVHGKGYMVLRTSDTKKAKEVILRENLECLSVEQLTQL